MKLIQINCEELVEGYESPVANLAGSKENEDEDEGDDEDITADTDPSSSKKGTSKSSSSKSISITSRTMSEFDTCAPEKSEEFDPVQGNREIFFPFFKHDWPHLLQLSIGTLCYSCESPKENSDCQISPNQTTTIMCESQQHICFTKKIQNVAGDLREIFFVLGKLKKNQKF